MYKLKTTILAAVLCLFSTAGISAQKAAPSPWKFSLDGSFSFQYPPLGYMLLGINGGASRNFLNNAVFPMTLQADLGLELSPVTFDERLRLRFTPVALLVFEAGYMGGLGWPIHSFKAHGCGLGSMTEESAIDDKPGVEINNLSFKGTLQFDFGVIFPGDWHHVLIQSSHEASWWGSNAKKGQVWVYQNTDYKTGWAYNGSAVLGYSFPALPVLDTAALRYEYGWSPLFSRWEKGKVTLALMLVPLKRLNLTLAFWYDRTSGKIYYKDSPFAGAIMANWKIY
jgi:hypothetical protein